MRMVFPSLQQMHLNLAEYAGVSGIESANPFALLQACSAWDSLVGIVSLSGGVSHVVVSFGNIGTCTCMSCVDLSVTN